ncbi:retrovirus-related pol polyprotein from transposon TNT 1-94 [Tanacetum coccineum]
MYVCPAVGSMCAVTMADMNVPANDAPIEQAPDVAPPIRTDDQIMSVNKWVPIGKSNRVLDVLKSRRNPIFPMAVALLKNTNFFRAFIASSTIPAIYIQQDALDITPANDNNPFVAPPSSDTVIDYVNTLGYPNTLKNVSVSNQKPSQPPTRCRSRDLQLGLSMINMCLTSKTAGYDRPRHPKFLTDKKNLATDARERGKAVKEGATESSEATKVTKTKAAKATKPAGDKAPKPTATQPPIPKPAPTQPSKAVSEKKRKLVKETPDEPSPAKRSKGGLVMKKRKPKSPLKLVDEPSNEGVLIEEPAYNEEDADLERALELSLMEQGVQTQGPARPVVIREPESGRIQPLPERRPHMPTKSSTHAESPSIDAELNLTDSETESDVEASKINAGSQDEGQAGPNPSEQDEGQAGLNPGTLDEGQAGLNPGTLNEGQAGSNPGDTA